MATYTICDMCGRKISVFFYSLEIRNVTDPTDYTINFDCDLCKNCVKSIRDFIKEERKTNEHLDQELE